MPRNTYDRERRWRREDDEDRFRRENRQRGREDWWDDDREDFRGEMRDRYDYEDEDDWMTYGRPEAGRRGRYGREGRFDEESWRGGREDWTGYEGDLEREGRMRGRDYWNTYGRGYGPEGRMGRRGRWRENRPAYDRGYGRQGGQYGREGFGRRSDYDYEFYDEDRVANPYEEPADWTYTEVWTIEGPFTGIGPQGYRRSDERIFEDVCERLTQHGQIDARDMEVHVNNGEVTLRGKVQDRRMKRLAEDMAETVDGVWDVHNQLRVEEEQRKQQRFDRPQEQRQMGQSEMRNQIREGMKVTGLDGGEIGEVKEARNNDFLVDRPMARDVYVPHQAVEHVTGDRITLNVRAGDVNDQNWPAPELLETEERGGE